MHQVISITTHLPRHISTNHRDNNLRLIYSSVRIIMISTAQQQQHHFNLHAGGRCNSTHIIIIGAWPVLRCEQDHSLDSFETTTTSNNINYDEKEGYCCIVPPAACCHCREGGCIQQWWIPTRGAQGVAERQQRAHRGKFGSVEGVLIIDYDR
jgi:hypothetical protein